MKKQHDDDDDDDDYDDYDDDDEEEVRGFEIINGKRVWSEYGSRFEALYCGISSLLEHGMVAEANKMLPDYLYAQYDSPGSNISWRMAAQAMAQVVKEGFSYVYKGPTPLATDEFGNIMEFIKSANFYCRLDDDLEEIREIADAVKGQMKLQREQSSKPTPPPPPGSFGGGGAPPQEKTRQQKPKSKQPKQQQKRVAVSAQQAEEALASWNNASSEGSFFAKLANVRSLLARDAAASSSTTSSSLSGKQEPSNGSDAGGGGVSSSPSSDKKNNKKKSKKKKNKKKNTEGQAKTSVGFEEAFTEEDFEADDDEYDRDIAVVWEYEDSDGVWRRFPDRIECGLESLRVMGAPAFMYRPGNPDCDGMYVDERDRRPTDVADGEVATRHVTFSDMTEREVYTGASRRVQRRGKKGRAQGVNTSWFV